MRYDEYLQAGYPIASGVIEGACRHVIKDRMEQGGMRWTLGGSRGHAERSLGLCLQRLGRIRQLAASGSHPPSASAQGVGARLPGFQSMIAGGRVVTPNLAGGSWSGRSVGSPNAGPFWFVMTNMLATTSA